MIAVAPRATTFGFAISSQLTHRAAENLNRAFSIRRSSSSFSLAFSEAYICSTYFSPSYQ
jgi:hypothetical protein